MHWQLYISHSPPMCILVVVPVYHAHCNNTYMLIDYRQFRAQGKGGTREQLPGDQIKLSNISVPWHLHIIVTCQFVPDKRAICGPKARKIP